MKVLEVYNDFLPRHGGVATYIYDVSRTLIEDGHEPSVLAWDPPAPSFEVIDGIAVHRFKMPPVFANLRYIRLFYLAQKINSIIKLNKIDVIHAHDYLPGLASAIAARYSKTPVVTTFHLPIDKTSYIAASTRFPPLKAIEKLLKQLFINKTSAIICVSNFTYKETLKLGFPSSKLRVIYNWFTPAKTSSTKKDLSNSIRTGKNLIILSVGRLEEKQKRFSILIQACKIVLDKGFNVNLFIVGTGPSKSSYEQLIDQLQLKKHAYLKGNLDDSALAYLYDKCNVFVLSSSFEGLPLVVLEAMSHNKPVVATSIGGVMDLINDGYNGLLTDSTAESIAAGIEQIIGNPELAALFVERSQKILSADFSKTNCRKIIKALKNNCR